MEIQSIKSLSTRLIKIKQNNKMFTRIWKSNRKHFNKMVTKTSRHLKSKEVSSKKLAKIKRFN